MKIGLLVPSRERLNLKLTLISSIITSISNIDNIELYFGVDDDDPTKKIVDKICNAIPFVNVIPVHNNGKFIGINKIWNILAKAAFDRCDIFGYIGDDMIFRTPDWDITILNEFKEENCPPDKIKMVHCWDGYHGANLCVNAFVHKKYYEILGYFCREEFLINWSDQWMYQTFKAFDRIKYIPDIYIEHNHWILGKRPCDNTGARMCQMDKTQSGESISDKLWHDLAPERIKDVEKLASYLKMQPNWNYVDRGPK